MLGAFVQACSAGAAAHRPTPLLLWLLMMKNESQVHLSFEVMSSCSLVLMSRVRNIWKRSDVMLQQVGLETKEATRFDVFHFVSSLLIPLMKRMKKM